MLCKIIVAVLFLFPQFVLASNLIEVGINEDGSKTTGQLEIWHDAEEKQNILSIEQLYRQGELKPLLSKGSTGLKPGAFWSHFVLHNVTDQTRTFNLEYVDHQLIRLEAYARVSTTKGSFELITDISMADKFSKRQVNHNRFVVPITIAPHETTEFFVKFASHHAGFVFPSMRIWSPENLNRTHTAETSIIMFLFGGIFLMSIISMVGALATKDKTFQIYAIYAISKIIGWCTILGYTHQFLIKDNFHWNYMSIAGALPVFFGVIFARTFLQTRQFTPKIDYLFLIMMADSILMVICALFGLTGLAVLSVTVVLFLYPVMSIAGIVRWRQGSIDAGVFSLAWSLLVFGLVVQALRDLGVVQHNMVNYYWPAFASFVEMLGIMAAMGIKVRRLRLQKDDAEYRYLQQLEHSKAELEQQVLERTQELEKAKQAAEHEARTDPLTGIYNRRSFFMEAGKRLNLALRKKQHLSLLMFDIDHFKSINDTYGHKMGDESLRQFSKTIISNLRNSDVWGRLGGEEFALVLCEDKQATLQTAERLRKEIANIKIPTPNGYITLTASIGVAHLHNETNIETLLNMADDALYKAKNGGRDQIVEY